MNLSLVVTALLMGLFGGHHCLIMCSAPCAGVVKAAALRFEPMPPTRGQQVRLFATFHAGRLAAYAIAGALVAAFFNSLGWASDHAIALKPVWVLAHVFILVWALLLVITGRQPLWLNRIGGTLSNRLRPWLGTSWGLLASGALWVLLPCGLLYSALGTASLSSTPLGGALVMAAFGIGSVLWLGVAPWLWSKLHGWGRQAGRDWGIRLAGLLLTVVAGQALWMDMKHLYQLWCTT
ncbi:MAG: sulfite exporter TauE/SafE family protein [Burkholderiaceae bacterium]|jgi:sulfite exporter TauE/SafE|nr:sulfite exporter TauE/SafE family protein [Burkholderiaceae bacterium]